MDKTVALWKWLLLFILAVVLGFVGLVALNIWTDSIENYVLIVLGAVALLALYWGGVRLIEKGPAKDLSLKRLAPHLGLGLLFGALFMGCVVGIIALCGYASFAAGDCTGREIAAACFLCLSTAVGEETLFRGILFRWLDERWGVVPALIVSGLLFGFLHLGNPNATVWSSIAIAIEAGLMLGAAYKWSGTLWFPIGIHWAWNYVQGTVFGIAVSGQDVGGSLWQTAMEGPKLITGGTFGAEASLVAVLLGAALTVFFLIRRHR